MFKTNAFISGFSTRADGKVLICDLEGTTINIPKELMIFTPLPTQMFSGKCVVIDPKGELINNAPPMSLRMNRSKPLTLLEKLEVYYESNCSRK